MGQSLWVIRKTRAGFSGENGTRQQSWKSFFDAEKKSELSFGKKEREERKMESRKEDEDDVSILSSESGGDKRNDSQNARRLPKLL